MLPLLQLLRDGKEHSLSQAIETLALQFHLTEADRKELLPSGRQAKFDNRVGWARTYLKKAALLQSTGRGKFQITQRGLDVLKENPTEINNKYLEQFPEYLDFKNSSRQKNSGTTKKPDAFSQTPQEILETSYQLLRNELAQDILQQIKTCSPKFFETLVVDLLTAMGYGGSRKDAGQAVGQTGDGGIDGIINEDRLGLDMIYIQAKRWQSTVGRPIMQAFAGSLEGLRAKRGILITTSQFSKEAQEYVQVIEKRIVLIDGEKLAQLMIDHNVGVTEVERYVIKKIDLDDFESD